MSWDLFSSGEPVIIVSSCLIGKKCAYDGRDRLSKEVLNLCGKYGCVDVCPEMSGGLPCPRERHEIRNGRVVSESGIDRTGEFISGANIALDEAGRRLASVAILKSKSPSCGKGSVYDGTFEGRLVPGNGVTAELFIRNGMKVFTENEIDSACLALEEQFRQRRV